MEGDFFKGVKILYCRPEIATLFALKFRRQAPPMWYKLSNDI
jgi:hypothetical protein